MLYKTKPKQIANRGQRRMRAMKDTQEVIRYTNDSLHMPEIDHSTQMVFCAMQMSTPATQFY